jgi:DNA primase
LKEERGLSDDVLNEFQVGYCPKRSNHEMSGRIITPIHDAYGNFVALSSRQLGTKNFFHESFEKGFYLYGLHIAKPNIIQTQKAIVVEGEFDVMYLHCNGIPIAVGMCGSSFTIFQLAILSRYCNRIYIVFDGDKKREQSIKRVMDMYAEKRLLFESCNVRLIPVRLPLGYDPDDFVKKNDRASFIELLKKSESTR